MLKETLLLFTLQVQIKWNKNIGPFNPRSVISSPFVQPCLPQLQVCDALSLTCRGAILGEVLNFISSFCNL